MQQGETIKLETSTTSAAWPQIERRRRLSTAALAVANEKVAAAYSPVVVAGLVRVADFLMITVLGLAIYFAYVSQGVFSWSYLALVLAIAAASVVTFQAADLYDVQVFRDLFNQFTRLGSAWSLVFLLVIGAAFLAKIGGSVSRVWLSALYVMGLITLLGGRAVLRQLVRRWGREGRLDRRTVIIGADASGEKLIRALGAQEDSDIKMLGVFDDRMDERAAAQSCAGQPKLGKVDDIVEFARRTRVDLVLFALPISAETRILAMIKKLWVLPVDIRLSAHTNTLRFRPRSYSFIGDLPVLDVFDQPITDWDTVMKWLFDRIVGALALVALSPVMAIVAVAIKLDSPGPVLFRQKRYGFNNERIDVFKFRSLYHNMADPTASKVVTKNDPRVTRVGRFIRKTSLDELPQLLNVVFKGNLSLVGPRPHAVYGKLEDRLFDEAVDGYFARHKVKPGITGWAQINGWRGEVDTQEKIQKRVEFDLFYIENWSVLFDLYILAKTPVALFKAENAY